MTYQSPPLGAWFTRLSSGTQIVLIFGAVCVLLCGVGLLGAALIPDDDLPGQPVAADRTTAAGTMPAAVPIAPSTAVTPPAPLPAPAVEPAPPAESPDPPPAEECDRYHYPDVCIPPSPPDLDCPDVPYKKFRVVRGDPHRFDADKDGIGCET